MGRKENEKYLMKDLKDILNHDEELSSEELIRYLQCEATGEERFAIENQMADSDFVNEAVEGLLNIKDPLLLNDYVNQLNNDLAKQTKKKAIRSNKRKIKDLNWLIISILAILLLCVAGYLMIHFT